MSNDAEAVDTTPTTAAHQKRPKKPRDIDLLTADSVTEANVDQNPVHPADDDHDSGQDDSLERRQVDKELLDRIAGHDCRGKEYDNLKDELWSYASSVMLGKLRTPTEFWSQLPWPPKATEYEMTRLRREPEVREQPATMTAAAGWRIFEKMILKNGEWDPTRGADLKTYFITGCLLAFSNEFRAWQKYEEWQRKERPNGDAGYLDWANLSQGLGEDEIISRVDSSNTLKEFDDIEFKILQLRFQKRLSYKKISGRLGVTEDRVKKTVHRVKRIKEGEDSGGSA